MHLHLTVAAEFLTSQTTGRQAAPPKGRDTGRQNFSRRRIDRQYAEPETPAN
jgi:hypothetical protein